MQQPIIISDHKNKPWAQPKEKMTDIEIRGVLSYLDDLIADAYEDAGISQADYPSLQYPTAENFFQTAYVDGTLTCTGYEALPAAPEGLEAEHVSYFYLTENHNIIAVFYVGEAEDEVLVLLT